jgi:bacillithiol biosynthesis deacetylase BshB1
MNGARTTVIVAAHPDDAELAMGGTIVRLLQVGWDVTLVDLTDGEPTPFGSRDQRAKEAVVASAALGLSQRVCLGLANRYLRATIENRRALARILREKRPSIVFGPAAIDAHPDHVEAARLVDISCFEAKLHKTKVSGEPHRVDRTYSYQPIHRLSCDKPLFVVDVTSVWDRKMAAIRAYESQLRGGACANGFSWTDRIEAICRYFGELTGCRYSEPFFGAAPLGPHDLPMVAELNSSAMNVASQDQGYADPRQRKIERAGTF